VTESVWTTSSDPLAMLSFLRDRVATSDRKLRLFAVACCRDVWDLIDGLEEAGIGLGRPAVWSAELLADGLADAAEVLRGVDDYVGLIDSGSSPESQLLQGALPALAGPPGEAAARAALHTARARYREAQFRAMRRRGESGRPSDESQDEGYAAVRATRVRQASFLRDIFGNPLRPVAFDPSWRTEAVVSLARGVYEEGAWERMAVLADALEDAGCADEDILSHSRAPGHHVRGCWVIDMVLGKA
jgi:hypothetical protein